MSTSVNLDRFSARDQLHGKPEPVIDPLQEAMRLASRSQRRVLWLAISTAVAWILAIGATVWVIEVCFNEITHNLPFYYYRYGKLHEETEGIPWEERTEEQRRESSALKGVIGAINEEAMILSQAAAVLVGVSALLSIWLIIASRRATLRQINANLMAITTELQRMMEKDLAALPAPAPLSGQ